MENEAKEQRANQLEELHRKLFPNSVSEDEEIFFDTRKPFKKLSLYDENVKFIYSNHS